MGTWGTYQSLIQLGVGLNIGYAMLETVLKPKFDAFVERQTAFLGAIKQEGTVIDASPLAQIIVKVIGRVAAPIVPWLFSIGVYAGFLLGIVNILLLVHASDHPNDDLIGFHRLVVIAVSVGWFILYALVLLSLRLLFSLCSGKLRTVP